MSSRSDKKREAEIRGLLSTRLVSDDARLLLRLLDEARAENADLQRTFDLMWDADQRAIEAWQEANPGNDMVWPDRAKLTGWLLDQMMKGEKEDHHG